MYKKKTHLRRCIPIYRIYQDLLVPGTCKKIHNPTNDMYIGFVSRSFFPEMYNICFTTVKRTNYDLRTSYAKYSLFISFNFFFYKYVQILLSSCYFFFLYLSFTYYLFLLIIHSHFYIILCREAGGNKNKKPI